MFIVFQHVRGLEWLFGIEPAEDDDNNNRLKWEARQRRLHKLRTNKQPILRSPTPTLTSPQPVHIQPESFISRFSGTQLY